MTAQCNRNGSATYKVRDWREHWASSRTPYWKRLATRCLRPWYDAQAKGQLSREAVEMWKPTYVFNGKGIHMEDRHAWAMGALNQRLKHIWVQGTGTGWDVMMWAPFRPERITASDLFSFEPSWSQIKAECKRTFGVEVDFVQSPLERMEALEDQSVDMCVSDAVFEHCTDLAAVLRETKRVLRPGGVLYASYGPLWHGFGGDHVSGRGGLEHGYNHLALEPAEHQHYIQGITGSDEDMQSGIRYIELDLFSKLNTAGYLQAFDAAGFQSRGLIVYLNPDALRFRSTYLDRFQSLSKRLGTGCLADDLLVHGNIVRYLAT